MEQCLAADIVQFAANLLLAFRSFHYFCSLVYIVNSCKQKLPGLSQNLIVTIIIFLVFIIYTRNYNQCSLVCLLVLQAEWIRLLQTQSFKATQRPLTRPIDFSSKTNNLGLVLDQHFGLPYELLQSSVVKTVAVPNRIHKHYITCTLCPWYPNMSTEINLLVVCFTYKYCLNFEQLLSY